MPRTIRNQTVVGTDHSVTVRVQELEPGARVEVIVVMNSDQEPETPPGTSFIDAIAGVTIDAPENYSVKFEDLHYRPSR
ncbi:MAG: hypothetical protein HY017_12075 [Betaproteobacteria bacterium]|nr:hypothetical protein [Betaproteobacteria bacterium]